MDKRLENERLALLGPRIQREQKARITALEAENAKLKAALKPFAEVYEAKDECAHYGHYKTAADVWKNSDLRAAFDDWKGEPTNAELDAVAPF